MLRALPLPLPLLVACTEDIGSPPSAPRASFVGTPARSESPRFSDWSTPVNLGPVVNSVDTDSDPFISKDGLSLYFHADRNRGGSGGRDIWVSRRASVDDPWGPPRNLGTTINSAAHEDRPTLSLDGHRLYFASDRPGGLGGFDLYVSRRRDKRDDFGWEAPVNLGSSINTMFSEQTSLAFLDDDIGDATSVYFASDRPFGVGDFDIYRSTLLRDGTFGPAALVPELSSPFRDRDPAIRRDGLEIFLSSNRPGTYGGQDLWVATRESTRESWSTPANMGAAINTPSRPAGEEQANDFRPSLSFDGRTLYFASAFRSGNMSFMFDIWVTTRSKLHHSADDEGRP